MGKEKDVAKLFAKADDLLRKVQNGAQRPSPTYTTVPHQNATEHKSPRESYMQNYQQSALVKGRFRSSTGLIVSGIAMTIIGGGGALTFGLVETIALLSDLVTDMSGVIVAGLIGAIMVGLFALLGFGVRNLVHASRLSDFRRVFGESEALSFEAIAAQLRISPGEALNRAQKLLKRGLIPWGCIDDERTTLMVTEGAYRHYRQLQQSYKAALESQRAAEQERAANEAARAAYEQNLAKRLMPSQYDFIEKSRAFLQQMRDLDERIADEAVSARIVGIEDVMRRILARAEEEPEVIAGMERLTSYYLPTVVKLLDTYDGLENQPVQGENIAKSRREIEQTLEVLKPAFEKMLDATYQDVHLDVTSDISVLHAMLAKEGLMESPLDMKPRQIGFTADLPSEKAPSETGASTTGQNPVSE